MGFLSRLFRRNPPPASITDVRGECGTWRVGDLAVCIAAGWECGHDGPAKGEIQRVARIVDGVGRYTPMRCHFLGFGAYGEWSFDARCFRKAVLDNQEADAEFVAKIKACRPVRKRERA